MRTKHEIIIGWVSCGIAIAGISIPFVGPFFIPELPSVRSLWTQDGWIGFFWTHEGPIGPIAIWLVELAALMAGIRGRRTKPGKIGIALSIAISLLVLVCLYIALMLIVGSLYWD